MESRKTILISIGASSSTGASSAGASSGAAASSVAAALSSNSLDVTSGSAAVPVTIAPVVSDSEQQQQQVEVQQPQARMTQGRFREYIITRILPNLVWAIHDYCSPDPEGSEA